MRILQEFEVARPVDAVWELFQDIPSVASCLPGAELVEDVGGGEYAGRMDARLGPMKAHFTGRALVTTDMRERTARIEGDGTDDRGGSRGRVVVDCRVSGDDRHTRVIVDADVVLSGKAAQFGRTSLVQEMARQLIADFSECLEKKLGETALDPDPSSRTHRIRVGSLLLRSLTTWAVTLWRSRFGKSPTPKLNGDRHST